MADLLPTAEQQELASSVARVLAAERTVLPALAQLGWLGIATDLPLVEQALVVREFGRALAPLQTLAAIAAARLAGDIASGAKRVALLAEDHLIDDEGADLALLITPQAASLFSIESRTTLTPFDDSLSLSRAIATAPIHHIESPQPHRDMLILAGAYATGLCEAITAMASDYARTREQFGQPIGAFQAIKHRCADMAIRADAAWSQTVFAALSPDSDYQALSAFIVATSYAIESAQENIQLHGAIGITEELAAHRFLKRAHVLDMVFGPINRCRDALLACDDPQ